MPHDLQAKEGSATDYQREVNFCEATRRWLTYTNAFVGFYLNAQVYNHRLIDANNCSIIVLDECPYNCSSFKTCQLPCVRYVMVFWRRVGFYNFN